MLFILTCHRAYMACRPHGVVALTSTPHIAAGAWISQERRGSEVRE